MYCLERGTQGSWPDSLPESCLKECGNGIWAGIPLCVGSEREESRVVWNGSLGVYLHPKTLKKPRKLCILAKIPGYLCGLESEGFRLQGQGGYKESWMQIQVGSINIWGPDGRMKQVPNPNFYRWAVALIFLHLVCVLQTDFTVCLSFNLKLNRCFTQTFHLQGMEGHCKTCRYPYPGISTVQDEFILLGFRLYRLYLSALF